MYNYQISRLNSDIVLLCRVYYGLKTETDKFAHSDGQTEGIKWCCF